MIAVRTLIVLCSIASVLTKPTVPEEMKEMVQMLHDTCVGETGVSNDLIENASNKGEFPKDTQLGCYIKCLMIQMAVMEDDGEIDKDAALAIMPEEARGRLEPIIDKCLILKGADACETSILVHKCYYDASPDDYLLV